MKLRLLRKWFVQYNFGEPRAAGGTQHNRSKSFKSVLQFQDDNGEWKDVPSVDDIESMAKANSDINNLRARRQ